VVYIHKIQWDTNHQTSINEGYEYFWYQHGVVTRGPGSGPFFSSDLTGDATTNDPWAAAQYLISVVIMYPPDQIVTGQVPTQTDLASAETIARYITGLP
jgi:hypothetical protein